MKDPAVRNKLLLATIESIEKYGIESTTIRTIAKEAGVAFSSLHYYFESKEQMVAEALEMAVGNAYSDLWAFWQTRTDDLAALREILLFLFDGSLQFPGVTRASLHAMLMLGQPEGITHNMINRVIGAIVDGMACKADIPHDLLAQRLIVAFSATLINGISPQAFESGTRIDYNVRENRVRMVDTLLAGLFKPLAEAETTANQNAKQEENP
jgi:AcrR family transcriptional regulator